MLLVIWIQNSVYTDWQFQDYESIIIYNMQEFNRESKGVYVPHYMWNILSCKFINSEL